MFADDIQPMPDKGALYLAPSGVLVDQRSYIDPFAQALSQSDHRDAETLVRDIVDALDYAQYDERITHILLDTNYWPVAASPNWKRSVAPCNALRKVANRLLPLAITFLSSSTFLAAHADEIIINPMGRIMLTGFGSYTSYYKEALDKLKVNMHIFRVGKYKSAVEPFIANSMSDEARADRVNLSTHCGSFTLPGRAFAWSTHWRHR